MKLWAGRFQKEIDSKTNDFNSSISFDSRMYREDIEGSIAHAQMLGQCGIIEQGEAEKIAEGLKGILDDLDSGALTIDPKAEDIHTFIEGELTSRLGDAGTCGPHDDPHCNRRGERSAAEIPSLPLVGGPDGRRCV